MGNGKEALDDVHVALSCNAIKDVKFAWVKFRIDFHRTGPAFYPAVDITRSTHDKMRKMEGMTTPKQPESNKGGQSNLSETLKLTKRSCFKSHNSRLQIKKLISQN